MDMTLMEGLSMAIIGLAGGLAVGSGLVSLLAVLDIIPRLAQISRSYTFIHWFEGAVVTGAVYWTVVDFFNIQFRLSELGTGFIGIMAGIFVGMLAAGLTEVLNVLPILAKRLQISEFIIGLLMAMVFGKIFGSLLEFLWFGQPK